MRICDECDSIMFEGYYDDGNYYCSNECLSKHYTEEEWLIAFDDGYSDSYFTDWDYCEADSCHILDYVEEHKDVVIERDGDVQGCVINKVRCSECNVATEYMKDHTFNKNGQVVKPYMSDEFVEYCVSAVERV